MYVNEYMKLAMELAEKGSGYVSPNPMVGAVIVKDGRIIGEGYHKKCGENHAEINAFEDAAQKGNDVAGSTMYVTLEPCSHYGKTPPCVEAIIRNRVAKVVVGILDPNPLVAGRGVEILKESGIEVEYGFMEEELKKQNEIFLKYITTKKPFCILKSAMTLDGKIATHTGDSKWITNELSRNYTHKIRHKVSGIMVGVNTIIKDDPMLNTRLEDRIPSDNAKIIVDTSGRLPLDSRILNQEWEKPVILATTDCIDRGKEEALTSKGVEVLKLPKRDGKVDLAELMSALGERGIDSVLLEGGGTLNYSALEAGIVDKVEFFIAPVILGGAQSKTPVEGAGVGYIKDAFKLKGLEIERFDEDILITGYIER